MGKARVRQPLREARPGRQLLLVRPQLLGKQSQVLWPAEGTGRADRIVLGHEQAAYFRGVYRLGALAVRGEVQQLYPPTAL